MDIPSIIKYFRDCYKADTRTFTLTNYFSAKVSHKYMVEGVDELLNGYLPQLPIPLDYANKVTKELSIYSKEKELYAFSVFVIGSEEGILDKKHAICAPLFIHPAKIISEGDFSYLKIDFDKTFLNVNFISKWIEKDADNFFQQVNESMVAGSSDFGGMGKLRRVLEENILDFNGEELLAYPELMTEKEVKKLLTIKSLKNQKGLRAVSACGLGVLLKSENTRGVLNELNLLCKDGFNHSVALKSLFSQNQQSKRRLSSGKNPGYLNEAQEKIIKTADGYTLSQVTGPPGTGKSYTIASLAIEYMSKGKSVLVSAKTDDAVNVIGNKVKYDFGLAEVVIRAGKSDYKKQLKEYIKNQLSKVRKGSFVNDSTEWKQLEKYFDEIKDRLDNVTDDLSKQMKRELDWGAYLAENADKNNLFSVVKKKYINWRNQLQNPHWKNTIDLFDYLDELGDVYKKYLISKHQFIRDQSMSVHRAQYVKFSSALSARQGSKRELMFDEIDFQEILKAFPIWLVKAGDISRVLPFKKEFFDIAIIDEATQCDIASILPILHRAKRVVFVGDPKQLRHVSFLSRAYQNELLRKHNLPVEHFDLFYNYRELSILDLVNNKLETSGQVNFLNEHFRSNPDIISFSNQAFYENSLTIMTDHPELRDVISTQFMKVNGERDKKGINHKEANALLSKLIELIAETPSDIEYIKTFGILSPFRDQTDYLNELIYQKISMEQIEKHRIMCGTAYSFQGEERDVMLLSICLDEKSHPTAYYHLNKPDVFNVSITRAKSEQYIFKSINTTDLKPSLLRDFLSYNWHEKSIYDYTESKEDFINEVIKSLSDNGIKTKISYPIIGRKIDILCQVSGGYFGIDLFGYPGDFEGIHTVEELKLLKRSGFKVFMLPYSYWYFDRDHCLEELMNFRNNLE